MSSSAEGWSKPEVPQAEGAAVARMSEKANARDMAAVLGGMLGAPHDAVLMLANTRCYLVLWPGKLW